MSAIEPCLVCGSDESTPNGEYIHRFKVGDSVRATVDGKLLDSGVVIEYVESKDSPYKVHWKYERYGSGSTWPRRDYLYGDNTESWTDAMALYHDYAHIDSAIAQLQLINEQELYERQNPEESKVRSGTNSRLTIGQPDGNDSRTANVWNGDRWVRARVATGLGQWVWDNKASGACRKCGEQVAQGEPVHRMPSRPLRSRKDPVIHVRCWDVP